MVQPTLGLTLAKGGAEIAERWVGFRVERGVVGCLGVYPPAARTSGSRRPTRTGHAPHEQATERMVQKSTEGRPRPPRWFGLVAIGAGLAGGLVLLELTVRLTSDRPLSLASQLPASPGRFTNPRALYDARLGWIPRPGIHSPSPNERQTIAANGTRVNGPAPPPGGRPILSLGDSFTFGDEVNDEETWPAALERETRTAVVNAGVFGYGIDQAVLRGLALMDALEPRAIVLAFIGHNITRTEFAYYNAWKPYFDAAAPIDRPRNVPVPPPSTPAPQPRFTELRRVLSYSFVCSALLRRWAPQWWNAGSVLRRHREGEAVSLALLVALDSVAKARGTRFLAVALGTNGQIGGNRRTPRLVAAARERGVDVLDLVAETQGSGADSAAGAYLPRGHYSARRLAWVAQRIARHLAASPRGASNP